MKHPFEAPKQEKPKEDQSVDIEFDDILDAPAEGGTREFTPEELEARHAALGRELAPERARGKAAHEAVAEAFFAKNPFLKMRFEKDPDAMRRFKEGLSQLIENRVRVYQTDAEDLPADKRFQDDLVVYSHQFEEEELRRKSGKRAA